MSRVFLYLGAIPDTDRPTAETAGRAEAIADGHDIAGVYWDNPDQLHVDVFDRPVFSDMYFDPPAGVTEVIAPPGAEDRDPELHAFFEDMRRPAPTCPRCDGQPIITAVTRNDEGEDVVEHVCPACQPDHPVSVSYREFKRNNPE